MLGCEKGNLYKGDTLGGDNFLFVLFIYFQAFSFLYFHCGFLTDSMMFVSFNSVHVKYKIFLSAMEYLPFFSMDESKGSFEDIIERYLCFIYIIYEILLIKMSRYI